MLVGFTGTIARFSLDKGNLAVILVFLVHLLVILVHLLVTQVDLTSDTSVISSD